MMQETNVDDKYYESEHSKIDMQCSIAGAVCSSYIYTYTDIELPNTLYLIITIIQV